MHSKSCQYGLPSETVQPSVHLSESFSMGDLNSLPVGRTGN